MKCEKCNYEWKSKSKLKYVTCPSCGLKTKNVLEEALKELDKVDNQ